MKKIFCFIAGLVIFSTVASAQTESTDSAYFSKEFFSTLPQNIWESITDDNLNISLTAIIQAKNDTCYYFEISYTSTSLIHRLS